jgi:hypothetical protein
MAKQTIMLKKHADVYEEFVAHEAIIPGALVELNSDNEVLNHDTAQGSVVPPMFAIEDALQGKGIGDDYAAGDQVRVWIPGRGDQVNALLKDEQTIVIGDFLESDGYGKLQKYSTPTSADQDTYPRAIVAMAMEAVDLSSLPEGSESSAGGIYHNPRIKVMVV